MRKYFVMFPLYFYIRKQSMIIYMHILKHILPYKGGISYWESKSYSSMIYQGMGKWL